jgi:hypothetical protein
MAIDFKKMMDPEFQAQVRREQEEAAARAKAHEEKLRGWLNTALAQLEELPQRERGFVRSCQHHLNTSGVLTEPQEKWLSDIAARY